MCRYNRGLVLHWMGPDACWLKTQRVFLQIGDRLTFLQKNFQRLLSPEIQRVFFGYYTLSTQLGTNLVFLYTTNDLIDI